MKLNRAALIAVIDEIEANEKVRSEEYLAAFKKYQDVHLQQFLDEELPKYRKLRDTLTQRIKTKKPLTREDYIESGMSNTWRNPQINYYAPPSSGYPFELDGKKYSPIQPKTQELTSLRAALGLIEDDIVTTSALASLGYRNLEWLFKKAAEAQKASQ